MEVGRQQPVVAAVQLAPGDRAAQHRPAAVGCQKGKRLVEKVGMIKHLFDSQIFNSGQQHHMAFCMATTGRLRLLVNRQ